MSPLLKTRDSITTVRHCYEKICAALPKSTPRPSWEAYYVAVAVLDSVHRLEQSVGTFESDWAHEVDRLLVEARGQ